MKMIVNYPSFSPYVYKKKKVRKSDNSDRVEIFFSSSTLKQGLNESGSLLCNSKPCVKETKPGDRTIPIIFLFFKIIFLTFLPSKIPRYSFSVASCIHLIPKLN